jgi:NAD+ diphosphatase
MPPARFTHTFAGNPLDRMGDSRADADWVARQLGHPAARAVSFWKGRPLVDGPERLARLPLPPGAAPERLLFLGLEDGDPLWAIDHEGDDAPGPVERFVELRAAAPGLAPGEAAIAAQARSLFEWRRRHRFCANCGQPSRSIDAGWKRVCPSCAAEHFPRTDPVVIMLALHAGAEGERCLLGRQAAWPAGLFSALAGFVEPGESLEEGCARELKEEAGLETVAVRYHSSQPWPWPSQLMIGLFAEVASDEVEPDAVEIEELRWFARDEARALLEGRHPEASAPPPFAIAHQLIRAWLE